MEIKEVRVQVSLACTSSSKVIDPLVVVPNNNEEEQHNNEPMIPFQHSLNRSQENEVTLTLGYKE